MLSPVVVMCVTYNSTRFQGTKISAVVLHMVEQADDGRAMVVTALNEKVKITNPCRTFAD